MPFLCDPSNPSDPSDPSNFSTPLSPPTSPLSPPSPSSSSPTLPSITHSLLQTAFSLKRDFRFLKLTSRESHRSSLHIALDESETHKLLRTSLTRLNNATKQFIRDANVLLDEEVNRSFDAYLHGLHRSEHFGDSGYSSQEGDENDLLDTMLTVEEKETRKELRRLLGVLEELRGVFWRRAGRYLLGGKGKEMGEEVEDLVVGRLIGDGNGNGEGDGEGDERKPGKEREDEDIQMGLERLAERLGMGKREEARVHRL